MKSSRLLSELHPYVASLATAHIAACAEVGIDLLIYNTFRDNEAQDELYSHGRTKPGPIVTNARGGKSFHNYRIAYDCVPCINGKPQWNSKELYLKVGTIGESLGLRWSGRWPGKLKETAHFQYSFGFTLAELSEGAVIPSFPSNEYKV